MSEKLEGWYVDAMEQNLGRLIRQQRAAGNTVDQLVELLMDPQVRGEDEELDPQQHTLTLAICVAICVRRLARIDMPT